MTWTPEIALLLDATAPYPDENTVSRIHRQIEHGLDWSELLRVAIPHGVLPLLSRNLSTLAASVVPPITLAQLQLHARQVAKRNRQQSVELVKILSALAREGIRMLPFKGPALAITAYRDIGARESHDLDLWVDPSQVARAYEWFRESGYHPVKHVVGVAQEVSNFADGHGEFFNPDRQVLIEIRSQLEPSEDSDFDPAFEPVWNRRGNATLDQLQIPVFGIEDLILGLAVHGSKHRWRRLNWVVDVAAMISAHPGIDWEGMLLRAREWHCRRRLLTAVTLASAFYGVVLPPLYIRAARDFAVRSAVSHIRSAVFRPQLRTFSSVGRSMLYSLQSRDSMSERLRCARHWLDRIVKADETQLVTPMSTNLRRAYRAVATARSCMAHSPSGANSSQTLTKPGN
jgi:hypothetical protein